MAPVLITNPDGAAGTKVFTFDDGKYQIRWHPNGRITAHRYGEAWQDFTGDKLVLTMLMAFEAMQENINELLIENQTLRTDRDAVVEQRDELERQAMNGRSYP